MNLLELMVKIALDDQASAKVAALGSKMKDTAKSGADSAQGSMGKFSGVFQAAADRAKGALGGVLTAATKIPGPIGAVATAAKGVGEGISKFAEGAKASLAKFSPAFDALKSGFQSAAKVGAAAFAAISAAATATAKVFMDNVNAVAQYGDSVDKMSQKMGMSAEAYQEWDAVMRHSGTSMETMKASMKTLANAAETGNEAFERIGITQEQIASMSQEELFEATITGLQNVEDTTQRTYLAGQLLGRGATELGALLNTSAEDTQAMRDRVHELGGVMSDEAVKAAAAYQDSLQDMQTAINGLRNKVFGAFLPDITNVMNGVQELLIGNIDGGLELITTGLNSAVQRVRDGLPQFIEQGGQIVGALLNGLVAAFPSLVMGMAEGIVALINDLSSHTDEMLDTAGTVFMSLATALLQIIPPLLSALASLLANLVAGIVSRAPQILGAGLQLMASLVSAIGQSVGGVVGAIGGVLQGAVNTVANFAQDMFNAGASIVRGLIDGIKSVIGGVADAIGNGLAAARELLPFSPAKRGPFSGRGWTLYSGRSMMEGLAEGIDQGAAWAESAMERAAGLVGGVGFGTPEMAFSTAGAGSSAFGQETNIYLGDVLINAPEDIKAIFREGFEELRLRGLI